jgi:hypothetical protein
VDEPVNPIQAAVLTAGSAPCVGYRRVNRGQDLAAAFEQDLARGRELDAPRGPVQKGFSDLGLEAADLLRKRRLSDMQPRRRAAEVSLLGHRDEIAQMSQLHGVITERRFISKS